MEKMPEDEKTREILDKLHKLIKAEDLIKDVHSRMTIILQIFLEKFIDYCSFLKSRNIDSIQKVQANEFIKRFLDNAFKEGDIWILR